MNQTEMDVTSLPVWTPWIVVDVPNCGDIPTGHSMKIGSAMTKQQAWDAARREMDACPEVVAMAVRRDGESL